MTQLGLTIDAGPVLRDVPALALWGPDGASLLPDRVLCLALDQPYAGLVVGGTKTLETRSWEWPYSPSWLAVYATRNPDRGAIRRLGSLAEPHREPTAAILGLVWIAGCRPMAPGDEAAACFPFEAGRFVWKVGAAHRFPRPDTSHLTRGPQKFVYVPRSVIIAGLGERPTSS